MTGTRVPQFASGRVELGHPCCRARATSRSGGKAAEVGHRLSWSSVSTQRRPEQGPQLRRGPGDGTQAVAGCPCHQGNHPLLQHHGVDPDSTGTPVAAGPQIPRGQPHPGQDRQTGRHRGPRRRIRLLRLRRVASTRVTGFSIAATRPARLALAGQSGYGDTTDRPVGPAHRYHRKRENGAVRFTGQAFGEGRFTGLARLPGQAFGGGTLHHVRCVLPGGADPADRVHQVPALRLTDHIGQPAADQRGVPRSERGPGPRGRRHDHQARPGQLGQEDRRAGESSPA
jgi:hypothetical protein